MKYKSGQCFPSSAAVVKKPEFSLSSKKDACLLFRQEEHPRKSQDTETHQGRDTSKAYSLPNDTCVLVKEKVCPVPLT